MINKIFKILNFLKINSWWISLTISIIAISFTLLRTTPFEMDWAGFVLGVLSLFITILIGWQISTVINFQKEKEDLLKEFNVSKNEISKLSVEFNAQYYLSNITLMKLYMRSNNHYEVIQCLSNILIKTLDNEENMELKLAWEYFKNKGFMFDKEDDKVESTYQLMFFRSKAELNDLNKLRLQELTKLLLISKYN